MSGHTPGPWVAKELYGGNRRWVVLHEETINGGSFKRRLDWSGQMDEANARLIAAAPDMLDALKMVRDYIVTMKGKGHEYQIVVDAAIEKATRSASHD